MDSGDESNNTQVHKKEQGEEGTAVPKEETKSSLEQIVNPNVVVTTAVELSGNTLKMSHSNAEPPAFISDQKSYAEYKVDLSIWSRITSLDKKIQAETVVYR